MMKFYFVCRYSSEILIWIQFKYQHNDDAPGTMRTKKGQARIDVNKEDLKSLTKFVEKCILLEKIKKIKEVKNLAPKKQKAKKMKK